MPDCVDGASVTAGMKGLIITREYTPICSAQEKQKTKNPEIYVKALTILLSSMRCASRINTALVKRGLSSHETRAAEPIGLVIVPLPVSRAPRTKLSISLEIHIGYDSYYTNV